MTHDHLRSLINGSIRYVIKKSKISTVTGYYFLKSENRFPDFEASLSQRVVLDLGLHWVICFNLETELESTSIRLDLLF
jgi:hypothetical protein